MSTTEDPLWDHPIDQSGAWLTNKARAGRLGHAAVLSQIFSARVAMEVARSQEATATALVNATNDVATKTQELATRTRHLVWVTMALAAITAVATIVAAVIAAQ